MLKHIEIFLRRLITWILSPSLTPISIATAGPLYPRGTQPQSILLLRQDRIGDVLITTPLLKTIREQYPDTRIDMVLSNNNKAATPAVAPYINSVVIYEKSLKGFVQCLVTIRKVRYDVVIDLMDNPSTTSTALVRMSKSRYSLGITKRNGSVYTHVVPLLDRSTVPIARRIAELLTAFDIDADAVSLQPLYPITLQEQQNWSIQNRLAANDRKVRLGINASGSGSGRRYSVEGTRQVIGKLQASMPELDIFLFSDTANAEWVRLVAAGMYVNVVPPSTSFHHAAIGFSMMHVLWTPDTSVVHLAAAWSIPVCVLYVHSNVDLLPWYPIGTEFRSLVTSTTTIENISADEVYEALKSLFAYCDIPNRLS